MTCYKSPVNIVQKSYRRRIPQCQPTVDLSPSPRLIPCELLASIDSAGKLQTSSPMTARKCRSLYAEVGAAIFDVLAVT